MGFRPLREPGAQEEGAGEAEQDRGDEGKTEAEVEAALGRPPCGPRTRLDSDGHVVGNTPPWWLRMADVNTTGQLGVGSRNYPRRPPSHSV